MSTPNQPFPSGAPQGFGPVPRQVVPGPAVQPSQVAGPGKARRQRSNSTSGRRFGVIGVVLAALTFLVLLFALTTSTTPEKTYVLRATQNLTPGVVVGAENLEAAPLDPESVEPGAITAASAEELLKLARGEDVDPEKAGQVVVGRIPLYPVFKGQQLRVEMFTTTAASIGAPLAEGERLVSVTADVDKALAGYFKTGDVVDVMAADQDGRVVLVAEAAKIVSVQADTSTLRSAQQRQAEEDGKDLSAGEVLPSQPIPGIYVLRVDAATASSLASADELRLYLLARGPEASPAPAVADRFTALCSSILPGRIEEAGNPAAQAVAREQFATYCSTSPQP